MVSIAEAEIDLFGSQLPSLDELKMLSALVNCSEVNKIAFAKQLEKHSAKALATGIGLFILGRAGEAVKRLKKAPVCGEKLVYLGYAFRKQKMFDKAVKSFAEAGTRQLDPLIVALEKADTFRRAGQFGKCEQELKSCSNFKNVSAEYHYQLGRLNDAQGQYDEGMANYEIAIELDSKHSQALFHLAYACDLRGDEDTAIDYYRQIAKSAPVYVNALLNLAVLYEDMGQYDKAAGCVEAVLDSHPNHQKAILFMKDIDNSMTMVYDEEKERRQDRHNQLLEVPISDFELSVRSRNCLKRMGILTLGDLLRITEAELLSYKNFGETSLVEIKKILDSKNLTLGMALQNNSDDENSGEDEDANKEILDKLVDDLQLSVRAKRALAKLGIKMISELVDKTEAELLGCKNFGVTSLNEIKERLTSYGLSLRKLE